MALFAVTKNNLDDTVKIFDAFYDNYLVINTNAYDVIYGYFLSVCETAEIAANFTAVLFRIAQESDVDCMLLLEEIQGSNLNNVQLSSIMAYYLNSFKSKTSLYGIGRIPTPVQPVARNVVL